MNVNSYCTLSSCHEMTIKLKTLLSLYLLHFKATKITKQRATSLDKSVPMLLHVLAFPMRFYRNTYILTFRCGCICVYHSVLLKHFPCYLPTTNWFYKQSQSARALLWYVSLFLFKIGLESNRVDIKLMNP